MARRYNEFSNQEFMTEDGDGDDSPIVSRQPALRLGMSDDPSSELGTGSWRTGLFDVQGDLWTFLYALACPCAVYGDNLQALGGVNGDCECCSYCIAPCCIGALGRERIRRAFRLSDDQNAGVVGTLTRKVFFCGAIGRLLENACLHTFFIPCAVAQEAREIQMHQTGNADRNYNVFPKSH